MTLQVLPWCNTFSRKAHKNRRGNARFMAGAAVNFRGSASPTAAVPPGHRTPPSSQTQSTTGTVTKLLLLCHLCSNNTKTHSHTLTCSSCWIRYFFCLMTPPPPQPFQLPDPNYLLTSVNPCIPNTPIRPPTSHLLLPCPLLYYPAGIALGTLQSLDSTPVTHPQTEGRRQWHFVEVDASFGAGGSLRDLFLIGSYISQGLKWGSKKKKKRVQLPWRKNSCSCTERGISGLVSYQQQEEIPKFYDSWLLYEASTLSQIPHCGIYKMSRITWIKKICWN